MSKSPEFGSSKGNEELSERDRLLKLLREDPALRQEVEEELANIDRQKDNNDREFRQQQKLIRRNRMLEDLDPQLKIDEEKSYGGRDGEHITILLGEKILGEIVSDSNLTGMDDREFQDKIFNLYQRSLSLEKGKERTSIIIAPDAQQLMDKFGISIRDFQLHLPDMDIDLFNKGENEKIELEKIDDRSISLTLKEYGGREVGYEIRDGKFLSDSRIVSIDTF